MGWRGRSGWERWWCMRMGRMWWAGPVRRGDSGRGGEGEGGSDGGGRGGAGGASLAVLLACEQAQAQAFGDEHDIEVGASDASVFLNELDGSVFVGHG